MRQSTVTLKGRTRCMTHRETFPCLPKSGNVYFNANYMLLLFVERESERERERFSMLPLVTPLKRISGLSAFMSLCLPTRDALFDSFSFVKCIQNTNAKDAERMRYARLTFMTNKKKNLQSYSKISGIFSTIR